MTLKDLAGRKLRTTLTALAIVLGVAMVSGTYVLTDTIQKAFDNLFQDSYANTDVVVSGRSIVDFSNSGGPTVPEALLDRIRRLETVETAAGAIEDSARLLDRDGDPIVVGGAPTLAFGVDPAQPRFNPLDLTAGDWPSGSTEIVIDKGTSERHDYEVGDRIRVASGKPVRTFTITGVARFGSVDSIGGATFAIFDVKTAQELFDKKGVLDGIQIAAAPGVSPQQLIDEIQPLLPRDVVAQTALEQAADDSGETNEGIAFVRYFLLAFGGIALFVGAFVIFNTLSITVAQRTREFATLRTIGATRRQLLVAVLTEGAVVGAFASVLGLGAGIGLARLLNWIFVQFEIELPRTAMVLAPRTVVVALVIGIGVSVLAGVFPALRATRVPPIAAVREGATLPPSRLAGITPYAAAATIVVAVLVLGYGLFAGDVGTRDRLFALGAGCLSLFVGVALVSPRLIAPAAPALAPLAEWLMIIVALVLRVVFLPVVLLVWAATAALRRVGRLDEVVGPLPQLRPDSILRTLAGENARRNPGRTAVTAAALMIGLALVTFVAVLGQGLRASVVETIDSQVQADYVLASSDNFSTFPAGAGEALADSPVVNEWTAVRAETARLGDDDAFVSGIDPATIADLYRFEWREGSVATLRELGGDGAILTVDEAERNDLAVGDAFSITTPDGTNVDLVVRGIYEPPALGSMLGDVSIAQATWDRVFPEPLDLNVYVDVAGEASPAAARALERAIAGFPTAVVQTKDEFVEANEAGVDILLNMLYVLLALSVIVSLFGMVNTMVLSVFERTRELGMLRAIGMTRAQVRRMVRHESVITALVGAALGLPLGIFLAALVTRALEDEGVVFRVPLVPLLVFAVIAVVAGLAAAVLPARRAARLNVLRALQYE